MTFQPLNPFGPGLSKGFRPPRRIGSSSAAGDQLELPHTIFQFNELPRSAVPPRCLFPQLRSPEFQPVLPPLQSRGRSDANRGGSRRGQRDKGGWIRHSGLLSVSQFLDLALENILSVDGDAFQHREALLQLPDLFGEPESF